MTDFKNIIDEIIVLIDLGVVNLNTFHHKFDQYKTSCTIKLFNSIAEFIV